MKAAKSCSREHCEQLKLTYAYSTYAIDDSLYIMALEDGEPYADVSINLFVYGVLPGINQIVLPVYKFSKEFERAVKKDLVKKVLKRIDYGPYDAYGELVELKDDWRERVVPLDSLYN